MKHFAAIVCLILFYAGASAAFAVTPFLRAMFVSGSGNTADIEILPIGLRLTVRLSRPVQPGSFPEQAEFRCVMGADHECTFASPYVFLLDGQKAEVLGWNMQDVFRGGWIAHGPSKDCPDCTMAHGKAGEANVFMQLRIAKEDIPHAAHALRRGDEPPFRFMPDRPHWVRVDGIMAEIVAIEFS